MQVKFLDINVDINFDDQIFKGGNRSDHQCYLDDARFVVVAGIPLEFL